MTSPSANRAAPKVDRNIETSQSSFDGRLTPSIVVTRIAALNPAAYGCRLRETSEAAEAAEKSPVDSFRDMTQGRGFLLKKAAFALAFAAAFSAGVAVNAVPALAQPAPGLAEQARAAVVEPLVTGCNGNLPSGWQYRSSFRYCAECRFAGEAWEYTGNYLAHCQTYGDGYRLWTFCTACRSDESTPGWRPVPSAQYEHRSHHRTGHSQQG
ncbi:hypothetical protein [Plantactinospora sp. KLBMP9567]|uniref:hypothetical protein n=1 Tax=Plantactinospora sp. KLBMP9567 TaxID=3085900 RepID=UPI002981ABCF|nr:hypothetical protein [Plantactinospora sp. KLBMP9567]MDW5325819.1 hypothetical protein [Plantactinospora sp. KLBMP9567]